MLIHGYRLFLIFLSVFILAIVGSQLSSLADDRPPNVVLILADDLGYSDVGCFGATDISTPNLDTLAKEGSRFTSFYVAQAVCTASRAALMSGCYPNRVGMAGALNHTSTIGIHPDEWLLPEMFKERGYATICIGKWHLGTVPELRATRHGFDEWFGIPYSNDNSLYHPVLSKEMPPLPLHDGDRVVELDPDQSQFTRRFTDRAIQFIERHKDEPFFVYLPHVMPHVPIFASDSFKGSSRRGLFGDVVQELDTSIGDLLKTLDRLKLSDNTIIIFFSDNGPWLSYGEHAGSARPFREGKLTTYEGGMRSPLIVRWPNHVPASRVSDQPWMALDLLPTLTDIVGGKKPDKKIDGISMKEFLLGADTPKQAHDAIWFYAGDELHAVRQGKWKLHFKHPYLTTAGEPGKGGKPSNWGKAAPRSIKDSSMDAIASRHGQRVAQQEVALYDLESDPGETRNVASEHSDIVQALTNLGSAARADLGDSLTGEKGTGRREHADIAR